jgi:hypothetical protein
MFVVVSLLLTAVCLIPAAGKLSGHPKMRLAAAEFGIPWPRYQLLGLAELAAASGVIAGLFWRPIGVAAGIGMALLLLGAIATHRRAHHRISEAAPALVALANTAVYLAVALMA